MFTHLPTVHPKRQSRHVCARPSSSCVAVGQSQSVTYTAPYTFPWLETGASEGAVGVKFTAGKKGQSV